MSSKAVTILCLTIAALATLVLAANNMQFQSKRYVDVDVLENDLPLLQCQICHRLVRRLQLIEPQRRSKSKRAMTELEWLDSFTNICDPLEEDGRWITELAVIEEDDALLLKRMSKLYRSFRFKGHHLLFLSSISYKVN